MFSKVFWKSQEVKTRKLKKYQLSIKHHFCRSDIEQHVIKPPLEPGANSLISDYSHSPQQPLLWNILLERRGKAYSQTHRVFTSHWTFLIMKWQKDSASHWHSMTKTCRQIFVECALESRQSVVSIPTIQMLASLMWQQYMGTASNFHFQTYFTLAKALDDNIHFI